MNHRYSRLICLQAVVAGSLFAVASGCAYLPEGFSSRVNPESPEKLFVGDDTDQIPVAAPRVDTGPEKPGLKIRKSKRGNMESYVVRGQRYFTLDSFDGYSARGTASWYGPNFHGRTASNGEVYDMYRLTAAHKTLPLPTFARVTHLGNGRSVVVKINDRGPFSGDRIIDLSFAAALRLGMINDGTGEVEVKALSPEEVMVLSGPENKFDVDFYNTDENGEDTSTAIAQSEPAKLEDKSEELINVAAVEIDQSPIVAQPVTDELLDASADGSVLPDALPATEDQAALLEETEQVVTAQQAGESLDADLKDALLPVVADANVQGITVVPAALQTVPANDSNVSNSAKQDRKGYYIQAGVYADVADAEGIAVDVVLASKGEEVNVKPLKGSHLYRVTVGPIVTSEHATKVAGMLSEAGLENFTVHVK